VDAASTLQVGSAVLVNGCFALVVGTLTARIWLRGGDEAARSEHIVRTLNRTGLMAVGMALVGMCLSMWAAAAVMMGGSLGDAVAMIWTMLIQTAYGHAGLAGLAILLVTGVLSASPRTSTPVDAARTVLLLGFAASRALVSHAGEGGMFTRGLAIEWIHLLLMALWLGGVAIGGWLVVPLANAPKPGARLPIKRYLTRLSHAATIALLGMLATGFYNAWQRVGSVQNVLGNAYGEALLVKLGFVLLAVALGGYNKVWGFPALMRSNDASARVGAILRIESFLLLGALAAAAVLTTQQPPMAV
jgi:putative copper resistance protein D